MSYSRDVVYQIVFVPSTRVCEDENKGKIGTDCSDGDCVVMVVRVQDGGTCTPVMRVAFLVAHQGVA